MSSYLQLNFRKRTSRVVESMAIICTRGLVPVFVCLFEGVSSLDINYVQNIFTVDNTMVCKYV